MCAGRASAQQQPRRRRPPTVRLSLDDALRIAQAQSQTIEIARAGVTRAQRAAAQARSQYLPQLNASAGYSRTLASQFSSFARACRYDAAPSVARTPRHRREPTQRGARAVGDCQAAVAALDLSKTSFGAKNQYSLALAFSQNIYTGGRISAQNDAADAQLRSANIEVDGAARAGVARRDVGVLRRGARRPIRRDRRLVARADGGVARADEGRAPGRQRVGVRSAPRAGDARQSDPSRDSGALESPGRVSAAQAAAQHAARRLARSSRRASRRRTDRRCPRSRRNAPPTPSSPIARRCASSTRRSRAQEQQVKIARAERIPSLSLVSNYQRLYFPPNFIPRSRTA